MELKQNQPHSLNIDIIIQEMVEHEDRSHNVILFCVEEETSGEKEEVKGHNKSEVLEALT